MNRENISVGFLGVIIGIVLILLVIPAFGSRMMWYGSGMMSNNQSDRMLNQMDEHFIVQMIPHHEDAIAMAEIALVKSEHVEIKQLAANIIKAQSTEIEWMERWYKEWFGKEVGFISYAGAHDQPLMMQMGMMGDDTDMERLENAKPFDKAFIEEMIPHHQMAVMMAEMLSRSTGRSEMKDLAHDIIDGQTSEIVQMRDWYRTWYK